MKRCIFIIVVFSMLTLLSYNNYAESHASSESYIHPVSPALLYKNDSTQTRLVDWDLAEEVLMNYVNFVYNYISDLNNPKHIDTLLCKGIVDYYVLNNPVDGALAETQSITAYKLFQNNDSLCERLDTYMYSHQIPIKLRDTIWIRIAQDIQSYVLIEEEFDTCIIDERRVFDFFFEKGYWFDKIDDYCPYTSSVLCN